MKIEVLYFDGCPNHEPAIERVLELLREEGISAGVREVNVPDEAAARAAGFLGSPSIRINGLDVEPGARSSRDYGMMCRTYLIDGRREGLPSREMIRLALREAAKSNGAPFLLAGSVVAAIVASFCCILPIVFAMAGFSILGASAQFAAWRPYLLGLTFGLLGLGFYFAYRPGKKPCPPGSACARPSTRRSGRVALWLVAATVTLFAAFPYYSGTVAGPLLSGRSVGAATRAPQAPAMAHATFTIEGMDCAACAKAVENKLQAVAGVRKAAVSFEHKKAEVDYDAQSATPAQMEKAIAEAGYRAQRG